jgi:predicted phosphodiesterase
MRLAVLSDIHANQEALEAVLKHTWLKNVDKYICLGDIVGYGASPNQCINLLVSLQDCSFVLGNHDAAVLGLPVNMNREARQVIQWTKKEISRGGLWLLGEMRTVLRWDDILFCHSNPYKPRNWYYVDEKSYISSTFARSKAKIVFVGHTHVPVAITRKNFFCIYIRASEHSMVVPAAELNRQIFNGGSIGQPRDGDPRASYLIYDTVKKQVEFYRVPYDWELAGQKILSAGLPEMYAKRLLEGL